MFLRVDAFLGVALLRAVRSLVTGFCEKPPRNRASRGGFLFCLSTDQFRMNIFHSPSLKRQTLPPTVAIQTVSPVTVIE